MEKSYEHDMECFGNHMGIWTNYMGNPTGEKYEILGNRLDGIWNIWELEYMNIWENMNFKIQVFQSIVACEAIFLWGFPLKCSPEKRVFVKIGSCNLDP